MLSNAYDIDTMAARILRWWDAATAADLAEGLEWYDRANTLAESLAAGTQYTVDQCAGVIAALSPRIQWRTNALLAARLVDMAERGRAVNVPSGAGFYPNREKAWRILKGDWADPLDVLGGPKVRRFYCNIIGNESVVTVDVWAARAAEGETWRERAPEGRRYDAIERAYQLAASARGVTPRDMQAAVWVHIRKNWKGE